MVQFHIWVLLLLITLVFSWNCFFHSDNLENKIKLCISYSFILIGFWWIYMDYLKRVLYINVYSIKYLNYFKSFHFFTVNVLCLMLIVGFSNLFNDYFCVLFGCSMIANSFFSNFICMLDVCWNIYVNME